MRKYVLYTIFLFLTAGYLSGCSEYEMIKYADQPAINFMSGANGAGGDVSDGLLLAYNFGEQYKVWNKPQDTVLLKMKLEGNLSDQPLQIRLKVEKEEKFEPSEVVFAEDYVIEPGKYTTSLPVIIKCPEMRDSVFKVRVVVDYENSDVIAGTKERQAFVLTIKDQLTFSMVKMTRGDWDRAIAGKLGGYTNTKLRFMAYALQKINLSSIAYYGLSAAQAKQIQDKLKEYNDQHPGNPVVDEDGKPLVLEP